MNSYNIYVPSYKRAKTLRTPSYLTDAIVVCPESQVSEYRKYNNIKIKACPDSVEGNMAKKRNWIRDNADSDYIVMIDDDIRGIQRIEKREVEILKEKEVYRMIEKGFVLMEDLGTVLWGINLNSDPQNYREFMPFSMLSVILGPFTAHKLNTGLRYDERLPTKEDYDYAIQVIHEYHKTLRMNKYSYLANHIGGLDNGGSHSLRTMKIERKQAEIMEKKWGSDVVRFNFEKSIDPKVVVPLSGV